MMRPPANIRVIVGFDRRLWRETFPPPITTIDPQVWKQGPALARYYSCNGINLIDGPLDVIESIEPAAGVVTAAFDLPTSAVDRIASTFGIVSTKLQRVSNSARWLFGGFDIIDPRTQCSAIHSFEWTPAEMDDLKVTHSICLSLNGTIMEESTAQRLSTVFDKLLSPHAPFMPCGVWIRTE